MAAHRLLLLDFVGAAVTVIVLIAGAAPLAPHIDIPARALQVAGLVLIPFVALVFHTARRPRPTPLTLILAVNVVWFVASIALVLLRQPTTFGTWFVLGQAAVIVPLAAAEWRLLRRLRA